MSLTFAPDSVATNDTAHHNAATKHLSEGLHTPRQIIDALPKDATPWQQDSAIRANIRIPHVDWSKRPNPMRTPTTKADVPSGFSLNQPMYHSRSLVQPDSVYRPEYAVYRQGVAGDPVPYTIAGDNLITSVLLGCFILATLSISKSGNFISRQVKNFFRPQHEGTTVITETSSELRFQFFLVVVGAFMLSIFLYLYALSSVGATFVVSQYQLMAVYLAVLFGYIVLKYVGCTVVDSVFFGRRSHLAWVKSQLFVLAVCGVLVAPVVLLQVFFDLSVQKAAIGLLAIFVLSKILLFYKCFAIFSGRIGAFLQIFLYFCALEIVPPVTLWGCLLWISNCLKVNY